MIKLYDGQRSPNGRKVRLLAAELGIAIELVRLDFAKGELKTSQYLAKNPNGKVPTLEEDGFALWESAAIMKYLAAKRPDRGLYPADLKKQAQVDQWLFWWTSHPEAALYSLAIEKFVKPFLGQGGNDPALVAAAQADIDRYLPILESQLAGKEYVLGVPTILEFAILPWLEAAQGGIGLDLSAYPNITALSKRMQQKPYWATA